MATIMIVDDSAVMRKNIKVILERGGHEIVAEASDGREVLTRYINHRPDLVTMDISMVNVDGIEALQTLIRSFPTAKVVMISALGQKQQVLEAIKSGAKSYIVKPFEAEKMLQIIGKVLLAP
ncbi:MULTISPECIES: response regulator [Paenibacillus]|uniref:Response regulator n=1 Tax=Paenibacillus radicis (ex Xue et al. 2023) TaxID=2972489 RepID=A0ABT1YLT7_9BACL|nr:response regulator [Paenibacillus radicis (ex Xue et al. 2023)]MCR8634136.1 response regulator [Paenibacillus radicis (ex Xue et al. 2023)]